MNDALFVGLPSPSSKSAISYLSLFVPIAQLTRALKPLSPFWVIRHARVSSACHGGLWIRFPSERHKPERCICHCHL